MTNMDVNQIKMDRMRYTKNKLSANLVLCAILFDVLYFVDLYRSDVGSYYYTILIGASIIYNLVFLLAAFLCSEGVKSRKSNFMPALLVLGIGQFVRMFIIPAQAHSALIKGTETLVMADGQYFFMIAMLALSGVCCIAAGITSFLQNKSLNSYLNSIQSPTKAR